MEGSGRLRRGLILALYILVFWMILPTVLALPHFLLPEWDELIPWSKLLRAGGGVVGVIGIVVMAWAADELRRIGRGLPVSHLPPETLVKTGPYRFTRHPIYLGYALLVAGTALMLRASAVLLISLPIFLAVAVAYASIEERRLVERYGARYDLYRSEVPRFIPWPLLPITLIRAVVQVTFGLRVRGRTHCPTEDGYMVLSPHDSYLDPVYLLLAVRAPIHFLTTHDMYRTVLLSRFFASLGAVRYDRYKPNPGTTRAAIGIVRAGGVVGVFPDGGRSWYGEGCYSTQLARLLSRYEIPVLPVLIEGAYQAYPRWGAPRRHRVTVRIQPTRIIRAPSDLDPVLSDLRLRTVRSDTVGWTRARGIERILYICIDCGGVSTIRTEGSFVRCYRCEKRYRLGADMVLVPTAGRLVHRAHDDDTSVTLPEYHRRALQRLQALPAIRGQVTWTIEGSAKPEDRPMGTAVLHADPESLIATTDGAPRLVLSTQDIDAVIIRAASHLQVYSEGILHTFTFSTGSALMFQDYLRLHVFGNHFRKNRWQEMVGISEAIPADVANTGNERT